MCIILYYVSREKSFLHIKATEFINNKRDIFLICFYIIENDMPKYLKRQQIIISEVIRKIRNENYKIGESTEGSFLYGRDKQKAEKLFLQSKLVKNKLDFINKLKDSQKGEEVIIRYFIKYKVEKVVPVNEIDRELKSNLLSFLEGNISDANILASGILHHQKEELALITADKTHWTKENIEWAVPEQSNLRKKYPKIPEINYIQEL